jgi:S-formylglutathione hydrolase FrmB
MTARRSAIFFSLFVLAALTACTSTAITGTSTPQVAHTALPTHVRTINLPAISSPLPATSTPIPSATPIPSPTPAPLTEEVIKIPAPSLKDNLLGEPDEQFLQIYLPPSYEKSKLRYPVVYFLPGFGTDSQGRTDYFSAQTLASAMAGGGGKEMIIVVPNGANRLHGSFYVNSPVTGNWEDYVISDVIGYIDSHYRTLPDAGGRAIAGHSMGGFGALNLAMRHPGLFSAVYMLSPGVFDRNGLDDWLMFDNPKKVQAFISGLKSLKALPKEQALQKMTTFEGVPGYTMAYGAAFAPNPGAGPPFFDFPFEEKNGQVEQNAEVWARWDSGFGGWRQKVKQYQADLAHLNGIVIDYGTEDIEFIPRGSRFLSKLLNEAGISHQIFSFVGGHTDHIHERLLEVMLPFFSKSLPDPQ